MTRARAAVSPAFIVCLAILVAAASGFTAYTSYFQVYLRKLPIHADRAVRALPAETASWKRIGLDREESAAMVEELGTENYLTRTYVQKDPPSGKPPLVLELHLAYYTGMVDTVPHVPERCLVGGGWTIGGGTTVVSVPLDRSGWVPDRSVPEHLAGRLFTARLSNDTRFTDSPGRRVRLPYDADELRMHVTDFVEPRSGQRMHAGYFFIANGGLAHRAEGVRLLAFKLTDVYAYYLKVQINSSQAASAEEFARAAAALLDELLPEIMRCVPDWVEVEAGNVPAATQERAGRRASGHGFGPLASHDAAFPAAR